MKWILGVFLASTTLLANTMGEPVYTLKRVCLESLESHPLQLEITAMGEVSSSGWTQATLQQRRYKAPPADGILDLDFVATRPQGIALTVISPIQGKLRFQAPKWLKGVRIHSQSNALALSLQGGTCTGEHPAY